MFAKMVFHSSLLFSYSEEESTTIGSFSCECKLRMIFGMNKSSKSYIDVKAIFFTFAKVSKYNHDTWISHFLQTPRFCKTKFFH